MTHEEIVATVNAALVEEFELEPDQMRPDARLQEDLGLDSLDRVDMVVVLEKAFHCQVRDRNALARITTIGDIYALIAHEQEVAKHV